jgi:Protein of unknown function (DUF3352)
MIFEDRAFFRRKLRPALLITCLATLPFALHASPTLSAEIIAQSTTEKISEAHSANQQLAQVLPENTPLAFFLTTAEENWAALEQFELTTQLLELGAFMGALQSPLGLPLLPPSIDYAKDVQPWIGEQAVMAMLPDTTPRSIAVTDVTAQSFILLPIADQTALPAFLQLLETSRAEGAPEKTTYQGVELWVWPTRREPLDDPFGNPVESPVEPLPVPDAAGVKAAPTPPYPSLPWDFGEDYSTYPVAGLTVAQIGDCLVFAQEATAVKTLIDYQQPNQKALGESELFLRSAYGDNNGAIARLYANLSEVAKFNLDGSLPGLPSSPLPGLPGIPGFPGLALPPDARALAAKTLAGVTLDSLIYPQAEGIRLQGRVYGNHLLRAEATPELPYADSALSYVPAPTYSLSSGRDVAGLWRELANGLALNETTRDFLAQARNTVLLATGLDLDTELLGWMDREFVLFFFPSNRGAINSFSGGAGVEIGVAIQTSDRPTAQKTLDALDALVGQGMDVVSTTINNKPATSWQNAFPDAAGQPTSYLSHSWISEDTVLVTSGLGAMSGLLTATALESIDEYPTFLNATQSLAHPNNGYSYINTGSSLSFVYSLLGRWGLSADEPLFVQVKSLLGTIRGMGATTSSTQDYWQLDSLVNLAPAQLEGDFSVR